MLQSYESAKLTNLTDISRISRHIDFHPPPYGHVIREDGEVRIDIARGVDKKQCDIQILEMAVKFVSLADS